MAIGTAVSRMYARLVPWPEPPARWMLPSLETPSGFDFSPSPRTAP